MHTLNLARAIKKMSVNEIRLFIFENYYKRIGFSKGNSILIQNQLLQNIQKLYINYPRL